MLPLLLEHPIRVLEHILVGRGRGGQSCHTVPDFFALMIGNTAWQKWKGPFKLMSITFREKWFGMIGKEVKAAIGLKCR